MKNNVLLLLSLFSLNFLFAQTVLNEINQDSYDNYSNVYNYTYWENNWVSSGVDRSFNIQTSSFGLNVDFTNLNVNSLNIEDQGLSNSEAFSLAHSSIFLNTYAGEIGYAILQDGVVLNEKSATPTNTSRYDSQMAKYGSWYNTRFVSTNFTNSPSIDPYFTGIEFSNWHDLLNLKFHVKPTVSITNAQLQFSFEIPSVYSTTFNNGTLYAFANGNDQGFVVKAGENVDSLVIENNLVTVTTAVQDFITNYQYSVGLNLIPVQENISTTYETIDQQDEEVGVTMNYNGTNLTGSYMINYDSDESIHYLRVPNKNMGYVNCANIDEIIEVDYALENSSDYEKKARLCLFKTPESNVTGFNALICNADGTPSGLPLQVSKNWHNGTSQLFSGSWFYGYTEVVIPANTTINFQYRQTGAKWGETYSASSHQLSVVGSGVPRGGWLEAALGTFGENITHSPDYEFGKSNGCDLRPFLVTNQEYGGTSSQCSWTGNVGGVDMFIYEDDSNARMYQSEVKTHFQKYSPNLTETSISAYSADRNLKFDYTFYLKRSDDFTRVYYKVAMEALEDTSFNRFDLFQLGGDIYNAYTAQSVIYGNLTDGMLGSYAPSNDGSNNYTNDAIALEGDTPWVWAGDGLYFTGATSGIDIDTNNGFIIRDYQASFNGVENNTPYFRERSSSVGFATSYGNNPTSYCIVPPPTVTSFVAGDTMELFVEVAVLPKQAADYYGTNERFLEALTTYGNSYELLLREVQGNDIEVSSSTNTVVSDSFPITIQTSGDTALVGLTGGKGYMPLVFSGVTDITAPVLWKAQDGCWEEVDQSVHGNDFWQVEYVSSSEDFNLIYGVNLDTEDDNETTYYFYLGSTPPEPEIVIQSQIVGDSWSSNAEIEVEVDVDNVRLAPQVSESGTTSVATDSNYVWTGPNDFSYTGRIVDIYPVTTDDLGDYTVTYTNEYGCSDVDYYSISDLALSNDSFVVDGNVISLYPNPVQSILFATEKLELLSVYDISGKKIREFSNSNEFDFSNLELGVYFVAINNQTGNAQKIVKY